MIYKFHKNNPCPQGVNRNVIQVLYLQSYNLFVLRNFHERGLTSTIDIGKSFVKLCVCSTSIAISRVKFIDL